MTDSDDSEFNEGTNDARDLLLYFVLGAAVVGILFTYPLWVTNQTLQPNAASCLEQRVNFTITGTQLNLSTSNFYSGFDQKQILRAVGCVLKDDTIKCDLPAKGCVN